MAGGRAVAGVRNQDVSGLDVSMHEPSPVCGVERARHLREDLHRPFRVKRPVLLEEDAQVTAGDPAHGDEEEASSLAGLVDRHDVRVVDQCSEAGFPLEPRTELLVGCEAGRENLERDRTPEAELLGSVDDTHAAPPDECIDAVSGELAADRQVSSHDAPCSRSTTATATQGTNGCRSGPPSLLGCQLR